MKKHFAESELIINSDGSVFHLHLLPEQLADRVILVGDPGRVPTVAKFFDEQECDVSNREFRIITGSYKGKRITVVSTGIGCDNIDIVLNELDACANIDFNTREEKDQLRSLTVVRIGTCGGLQPYTPEGTFIASAKSIGFDGLLNFYAGRNDVCDLDFEENFMGYMQWEGNVGIAHPYVIDANPELLDRIAGDDMVRGVTIACGGFFGPQGRELRIPLATPIRTRKSWPTNTRANASPTSRWKAALWPDFRASWATKPSPAAWSSPTAWPAKPIPTTKTPSKRSSKRCSTASDWQRTSRKNKPNGSLCPRDGASRFVFFAKLNFLAHSTRKACIFDPHVCRKLTKNLQFCHTVSIFAPIFVFINLILSRK